MRNLHFSRRIIIVFNGLLMMVVVALMHASVTHAISVNSNQLNLQTDCNIAQTASFTGMLSIPEDTYNVYARLPSKGQTTNVQVYGEINDENATCSSIGTVTASGDQWTLVGTWTQPAGSTQTIFDLATNGLTSQLYANRPSIMLISQTHPTCMPTTECYVTINGEQGEVQPIGTLPNEDSLHIVRPIDPTQDEVKKVTYYVDNEPTYTTSTLKPFDLRYVTYRNQTLARVIEYTSGQRIVLTEAVPDSFQDNFWNLLFRIVQRNPNLVRITVGLVGLIVIGGGLYAIVQAIYRRYEWRLAHGLIKQKTRIVTAADRRKAYFRDHRRTIFKRAFLGLIGVIAICALVVLVNKYVVQIYKVDGQSMESTYHNGSSLFINNIPVTP